MRYVTHAPRGRSGVASRRPGAARAARAPAAPSATCDPRSAVDLRLSDEHEALRATVEEFAREEVAPVIGDCYAQGEFPYEIVAGMGRHRPVRPADPRGVRRHGRRLLRAVRRASRSWPGSTRRWRSRSRPRSRSAPCRSCASAPRSRSASGCRGWPRGELLGALRPHRAGRRLGRRRARAPPRCSTATSGSSTAPRRSSPTPGTDITGFVTVTAVTGHAARTAARRSRAILVPSGTPGLHRRAGVPQGRLGRLRHPRARRSTTSGSPRPTWWAQRGRGYAQFLSILDEGRIAIAALAAGLAQGCVDESVTYAGRSARRSGVRSAPTRPIAFLVADMEVRAHTARLAWRDAGGPHARRRAVQAARPRSRSCYSSEAAMDNAR